MPPLGAHERTHVRTHTQTDGQLENIIPSADPIHWMAGKIKMCHLIEINSKGPLNGR